MSHLQIGTASENPQIPPGDADAILGFEEAEAVRRAVTYLKEGGLAIINSRRLPPVEVISGMTTYPSSARLVELLSHITINAFSFDATAIAQQAGDPIAMNVVMLGALSESGCLPFSKGHLLDVMKKSISSRYLSMNLKAFELGSKAFRDPREVA